MEIIRVEDLPAKIQSAESIGLMVRAANARAMRVAPCLAEAPSPDQIAEASLVLLGAVKRWTETGAGSVQQQSAGPFAMTVDTRQRGGYTLWPSEITQLQEICSSGEKSAAFTVDTAPSLGGTHSPICALAFGATYCSCGADIAGTQIYEVVD